MIPRRFARHDDTFHVLAPAPPSVSLGENQRHSLDHLLVELGEAASRVVIAVVLAPAVEEVVEVAHDRVSGDVGVERPVSSRIWDRLGAWHLTRAADHARPDPTADQARSG
jgi:hypothetical protein